MGHGRTKGSKNLALEERKQIRRLFQRGMRVEDIIAITGRGESVVYRNTRDLKRKKPPPPAGKHAKRNDRILAPVEQGLTRAQIAKRVGISATQVGFVVARHPHIAWLIRTRRMKPQEIAKRYRLEMSTVARIAAGFRTPRGARTRSGGWRA